MTTLARVKCVLHSRAMLLQPPGILCLLVLYAGLSASLESGCESNSLGEFCGEPCETARWMVDKFGAKICRDCRQGHYYDSNTLNCASCSWPRTNNDRNVLGYCKDDARILQNHSPVKGTGLAKLDNSDKFIPPPRTKTTTTGTGRDKTFYETWRAAILLGGFFLLVATVIPATMWWHNRKSRRRHIRNMEKARADEEAARSKDPIKEDSNEAYDVLRRASHIDRYKSMADSYVVHGRKPSCVVHGRRVSSVIYGTVSPSVYNSRARSLDYVAKARSVDRERARSAGHVRDIAQNDYRTRIASIDKRMVVLYEEQDEEAASRGSDENSASTIGTKESGARKRDDEQTRCEEGITANDVTKASVSEEHDKDEGDLEDCQESGILDKHTGTSLTRHGRKVSSSEAEPGSRADSREAFENPGYPERRTSMWPTGSKKIVRYTDHGMSMPSIYEDPDGKKVFQNPRRPEQYVKTSRGGTKRYAERVTGMQQIDEDPDEESL